MTAAEPLPHAKGAPAGVGCPLCESDGGAVVVRDDRLRVVRVGDADMPAFYRVIWNDHVAEWTDLDTNDRTHCMQAVAVVERALRLDLAPTKINLASLGNAVPHLHWHVVARFQWDSHYPQPVWGPRQRDTDTARVAGVSARLAGVDTAIADALRPGPEPGTWPAPPA